MKTLFAIIAVAAFNIGFAQKTIELKSFKNITVGADMEVTLVKSNHSKLIIEDGDEEDINVFNEEGALVLSGDGNITLYYSNEIHNLIIASDAIVSSDDEIKSKELTITAAPDAEVTLKINVDKLQTAANSDAVITLSGKAGFHTAAFHSDAELHAKELIVQNTDIALSSDAVATITSKKIVNATVSSDAVLTIYGNPSKVNQQVSDDGEIVVVK